jgi:hypothetical protein
MRTRSTAAGGIFLFLGPILGVVYGLSSGQPIEWMMAGFGLGVVLAIIIWLVDKRRA